MSKAIHIVLMLLISVSPLFAAGGTIPTGLPTSFGFGAIDKSDSYAASTPHFYKGTAAGTCWDYSYAYLTSDFSASGYNTWTGWVAGGQWAANELKYWEARGQIQVFTLYYTPYTLSNYNDTTKMNQYYKDFKLLCQVIAANSTKKVIIHIEPDLLGYWRKAGRTATSTGAVQVGAANFGETCDGVAINNLPNTIQGWSEALYRIRNQYGGGKVLLAHHYTHWGNSASKDVLVDTSLSQTDVNTYVDDTTTFITQMENGKTYDLIFVDPSDRDADWFRFKGTGGEGNTRWTGPSHTGFTTARTWGKLGYVFDRVSTNLNRKMMFWQIPVGNTYYKTCNNSDNHYRDNSAQEFIPSLSQNGATGTPGDAYSNTVTAGGPGYWASKGFIGVLFGEGGYDQYQTAFNTVCHLRDWPNDGITNPASQTAGDSPYSIWGTATSTDADNDGGYIRKAVAAYCAKGKYPLNGTAPTSTFTAVVPTSTFTFTRTNTPTNTATFTYTFTSTNTAVPPTATFTATRTNTAVPPTNTYTSTTTPTRTNTPVPPTSTFTSTNTAVPPTATYTATRTNTALPPTNTFTTVPTNTSTNTAVIPTATFTFTRTSTAVPPTSTNTNTVPPASTSTFTPTNTPVPPTATFTLTRTNTAVPPTSTMTNTPLPGSTATFTPSNTAVPPTSTNTYTWTVTNTFTRTATNTPVQPTATITNTPPPGSTATFTFTVTSQVPTATETQTSSWVTPMPTQSESPEIPDVIPNQNPYVKGKLILYFAPTNTLKDVSFKLYTTSARLIKQQKSPDHVFKGGAMIEVPEEYMKTLGNGTYYYIITGKTSDGKIVRSKSKPILIIKEHKK